jgi:hypothetical protein
MPVCRTNRRSHRSRLAALMIMLSCTRGQRLVNPGHSATGKEGTRRNPFVFAPFECSARTRVKLMLIFVVDFGFVSWRVLLGLGDDDLLRDASGYVPSLPFRSAIRRAPALSAPVRSWGNADGTLPVISDGLNHQPTARFIGNTTYVLTLTGEFWKIEGVLVSDLAGGRSRNTRTIRHVRRQPQRPPSRGGTRDRLHAGRQVVRPLPPAVDSGRCQPLHRMTPDWLPSVYKRLAGHWRE